MVADLRRNVQPPEVHGGHSHTTMGVIADYA